MNNTAIKRTKKEFKEVLNKRHFKLPKTKRFWQHKRKREYGDYLYSHDKELFDLYYNEWITNTKKGKILKQVEG